MPHQKLNIVLSHVVLSGTGIYCMTQLKNERFFPPHVTYGLIVVNNIIGVCCWERNMNNTTILKMYRFTSYCQLLFALPCITTTVWLKNGYSEEWSWAWAVVPVFLLLCYLISEDVNAELVDLMILFNLVGLGAVSFIKEVNYGIPATIAYALAHYYTTRIALYNYGLSFYSYFVLRAIG